MVTFHSTRLERTTTANFSCHDISADLQTFMDATRIRNELHLRPKIATEQPRNLNVHIIGLKLGDILTLAGVADRLKLYL